MPAEGDWDEIDLDELVNQRPSCLMCLLTILVYVLLCLLWEWING